MSIHNPATVETAVEVLKITPLAAARIKSLMLEKNAPDHALRVFVRGGGCSCSGGMEYGMMFDKNPQPADRVVEIEGVRLIVDPVSLEYVQGASIDFVDGPMGGSFRIDNPNTVASSCGCGGHDGGCEG